MFKQYFLLNIKSNIWGNNCAKVQRWLGSKKCDEIAYTKRIIYNMRFLVSSKEKMGKSASVS